MRTKILTVIMLLFGISGYSQDLYRSGVFLHLDVGANIWGPNGSQTSVPQEVTRYNQENDYFGEFSYSFSEARFPETPANNEWYRWHAIFRGLDPTANINPYLNGYKIVIIKTSFPSSSITEWGVSADTLNPSKKSVYNYKWHWRNIIRIMESVSDVFFVIWTNAPLVAAQTNDLDAMHSHLFSKWAMDTLARGNDPSYGTFPKNVYVFDYFHKVAGTDNKLREMYAVSQNDSRPNAGATMLVAAQLVREVCDAARNYEAERLPIQAPVLVYPIGDEKNVPINPVLRWKKVPTAIEYYIQVSKGVQFTNLELDISTKDTSYKMTNLQHNTKYWWRVKSIRNHSNASEWTLMQSFWTIVEKPEVPELIYPAESAVQVELVPLFRWKSSQRAVEYRIQVATDKQFNYRVVNTDYSQDTFYIPLPSELFQTNMTYYWRVMAKNAGGESAWTPYRQFTTMMPLPARPVLVSPENNEDFLPLELSFRWNKVPLVSSYHLQIADDIDFAEPVYDNNAIKDTTITVTKILDYDKDYYWRVAAINATGKGVWSEVWTFGTLDPELFIPVLISPANDEENVGLKPIFIWSPKANAIKYILQIFLSAPDGDLIADIYDISDTSFVLDFDLMEGEVYYWRVQTEYKGKFSKWSEFFKFKTDIAGSVSDGGQGGIEIYPNPAGDYIEVKLDTEVVTPINELRIYNSLGICVLNLSGVSSNGGVIRTDISRLPTGLYYLRVGNLFGTFIIL